MARNNNILKALLINSGLLLTLACCSEEKKEYLINLPDYSPTLHESIGKYYFLPVKDEFRDDYKYLKLKKGDTVFLEIKKDSTYTFNKFFYNQAYSENNIGGKVVIDKNGKIVISPQLVLKNARIYLWGFKKTEKNRLYFYYGINSPTDPTEYEYFILFKKMK